MSSPIPRILSWSRRHRANAIAAVLVLAALSAIGLRGLSFDTDVLSLLPREGRTVPAFRTFVETFGSADDLYVILSAPGKDIGEHDDDVDAWAERLRGTPGITRVDTGRLDRSRDLNWLGDRRLLLLSDDRLRQALRRFEGDTLRQTLRSRRALLTVPSPAVADMVRHDPLALFDLVRDELGAAQAGVNLGVNDAGYVSADGQSRLLIAKPERPPFDGEFSRALMGRLEALRAAPMAPAPDAESGSGAAPRRPLRVQFAGGHRIAVETESVIRRESIVNTVGSLALILPLLFIVFRSLWLVVVGSIPSAVSLILTLGMLGLTGATLSAAATASSAMLFGLGVDGVVLLYVAYTLAIRAGDDPPSAIDGLGGPASSMLLGMWTTAATFYGLMFVDFPSLEQLGALIGHSMVLCGLLTLVLVPALLPRKRPARPARSLLMPRFAAWVGRRTQLILVAAAVVTLVLGAAATRLEINPTLDRLRSVTPGATLLQQIAPMFGLPNDVYVVIARGANLDDLLAANERLRSKLTTVLPLIPVQAPSSLLPSEATQATRGQMLKEIAPDKVAARLGEAEVAEGFRAGSFAPFRERLPMLLQPGQRLTYDGYVEHGLGDLIGRFIARRDKEWMLATYAFPTRNEDASALANAVAAVDPHATLTGLALVNRELADRFLPQFVKGLSIGSIVVIVLVLAAFRNWRLSLLSLAPTAIGIVWAAGALALAGVALDLFALFAVVTFVGIGVDYGVHVVHRYRERGNAMHAISELAPVILVAATITFLGYGTLITSTYPPLRSIGVVSGVSTIALAAASLFVLPAILTWLGHERAA
ncbi:MAG TPA: MMPL family transporter [Vicinamibacterales bacterium]